MGPYLKNLFNFVPFDTRLIMASVDIIVMNENNEVLITKRTDGGKWCTPGGGCEETDTFLQTAVNELSEEVGIFANKEDFKFIGTLSQEDLMVVHYDNGGSTRYYSTAFMYNMKQTDKIELIDGEATEYCFVSLDSAINDYDLLPGSKFALTQVNNNNIPFIN